MLEYAEVVHDKKKKCYGQRYVERRTARIWKAVDAYEKGTYKDWKEIYASYPGQITSTDNQYSRISLKDLVRKWKERTLKSVGDWAKFFGECEV